MTKTSFKKDSFLYRSVFSLIIVFVIVNSCIEKGKKEKIKSNSFYSIPFSEIVKTKRQVKLSEFASDVKIIQLENIREALIGTFEDIEISKDYIFFMCWAKPILQFSRSGKLVRKIGNRGKGPKEYRGCLKMTIDEKNESVFIHTTHSSIMVYSFSGDYINTIKFPALDFIKWWIWSRDSMLVSYFEPVSGNEPYVFIEHNAKGDTLQTIPNYIFYDTESGAKPFHTSSFEEQNFSYRIENKLHLKGAYNDTVYSHDEKNQIKPKFLIELKQYKLPGDLIYERKWNRPMPDNLCWTGVHETSDYIFIPYGYHYNQNKPESQKEKKGFILYNKKSSEGLAIEESIEGGFIDDITGGPDFRPILTNDNTAFMLISALDLKKYLDSEQFKNKKVKNPAEKEKLEQLKKTININDNHFLVQVKL